MAYFCHDRLLCGIGAIFDTGPVTAAPVVERGHMRPYHYALAALLLSACSSGGSSTVDLTPSAPSTSLNSSFGTMMNNTRLATNASAPALVYDSDVGRAAQLHANDMFTRNYDSVQILGGGGTDIGDRVTDQGYSWEDIAQLIDRGENTTAAQVAAFSDDVCDAPNGTCYNRTNFAHFGVARAGSGADTRWVLVLTDPTGPNP